jgi:UDP-3-O-[3-hydroxymyristoyl] glucosamine N-acyltransferase
MGMTVGEIARLLGGTVQGDPATEITGVNGLQEAGPGDLCFVRNDQYLTKLHETKASAALIPKEVDPQPLSAAIVVAEPEQAFVRVLHLFAAERSTRPASGIHERAFVSPEAVLGANVSVGPGACVEEGAVLGDGVVLHPGAYIGRGSEVGPDTVVYPNAVIREGVRIGARCVLHAGACIGSDGFGFVPMGGAWMKIPQVGTVEIGDDVEIGSNTAVDRATFGVTKIGNGVKIDNLVQIGHNVQIGEHTVIAGMAGVAGSTVIGSQVRIGASAGVNGHITIGDGASVAARSGVTRSVAPGQVVSGFPAMDHAQQRRVMVVQAQLPELAKRVRQLEARLAALEDSKEL